MIGPVRHLSFPGKKQHADIRMTGVAAPIQGLVPAVHASLSAKRQGPRELLVEQKLDGVAVRETSMVLTQDGHTLIQKTWRPEYPSSKELLVYQDNEPLGDLVPALRIFHTYDKGRYLTYLRASATIRHL